MAKPFRVQLQRTTGWRMPPNTVSVARPGRWGNPFSDFRFLGRDRCIALFANTVRGCWSPSLVDGVSDQRADGAYRDHHAWMRRIGCHPSEAARSELRGKNLACWCALDQPCHADILLEVANEPW